MATAFTLMNQPGPDALASRATGGGNGSDNNNNQHPPSRGHYAKHNPRWLADEINDRATLLDKATIIVIRDIGIAAQLRNAISELPRSLRGRSETFYNPDDQAVTPVPPTSKTEPHHSNA
ncbi:hypothetical protein KC343_g7462 [Hortaea werneckii]|nr:hypothetical protein KC352_g15094 [Hortaea werneckii]KAI7562340.1 hypothetical protein KC317_g8471 [Hortaea werneckii]KAI7613359.1 hypothetical protein KC346_g7372 [Hortaea werneckii]KAI7623003.1 hypothetical protein KC343_g7462 [Hortaea werneckii]KAI7665062.1 hypothetical protein KC319_g7311 [Hortaea werneckii]